jgi:hypothetical protein
MKIDPEFFGYGRMNLRKVKKVRIQLVVSEQVNHLLDTLAEKERRTRSVIAELAIQAYEQKDGT